jgi:TolB protein
LLYAEIVVTQPGVASNPALYLETSSISANLSTDIKRKLIYSDWFKVVPAKSQASYTLTVSGHPTSTIRLSDKHNQTIDKCSFNLDLSKVSPKWHASLVVDQVLNRFFKSNGHISPAMATSQIAFCARVNGKKEIYLCDIDGSKLRKKTNFRSITALPRWSPDNRYLVYTVYGKASTNIFQTDLNTNRHRILSHYRGMNTGAAFRPQGNSIVMTLSKANSVDMYWMDLNNIGKLGRLTKNNSLESSPVFSPKGSKICYVASSVSSSGKVSTPRLHVMNASTLTSKPLFNDRSERVSPDWSKTSNQLVYSKRLGSQYVLATCDPNNPSSTETVITKLAGHWEDPSWAPDGRHLVCTRDTGGTKSLYIVDTLYKTVRKLNLNLQHCSSPSWSNLYR